MTLSARTVAAIAAPLISVGTVQAGPTVRAAIEIGLTPETMGACGATQAQVEAMLTILRDAATERSALFAARLALAQATRELAIVQVQLRNDPLSVPLQNQLQAAMAQVNSAQAAFDQAKQALREAVTTGLSAHQVQMVTARTRLAGMRAPVSFQVVEWTDEERKRIEAALIAEQRAAATIAPMPESAAQLLAEVRAEPAVAAAGQALSSNLASIQSVFASWQN